LAEVQAVQGRALMRSAIKELSALRAVLMLALAKAEMAAEAVKPESPESRRRRVADALEEIWDAAADELDSVLEGEFAPAPAPAKKSDVRKIKPSAHPRLQAWAERNEELTVRRYAEILRTETLASYAERLGVPMTAAERKVAEAQVAEFVGERSAELRAFTRETTARAFRHISEGATPAEARDILNSDLFAKVRNPALLEFRRWSKDTEAAVGRVSRAVREATNPDLAFRSLHAAMDRQIQRNVEALVGGRITEAEWRTRMARTFREHYAETYRLGKLKAGGEYTVTAADRKRILANLADERKFLDRWLRDVRGKYQLLTPEAFAERMKWRGGFYADALAGVFNEGWLDAQPKGAEVRWVTDPAAENCDDCIALEAEGWMPADSLDQTPGDGSTACGTNCCCHLVDQDGGQSAEPTEARGGPVVAAGEDG
jgi:hypothetical protein